MGSFGMYPGNTLLQPLRVSQIVRSYFKPALFSLNKTKADQQSRKITDPACLIGNYPDGCITQYLPLRSSVVSLSGCQDISAVIIRLERFTSAISFKKRLRFHYSLIFPHHHFW